MRWLLVLLLLPTAALAANLWTEQFEADGGYDYSYWSEGSGTPDEDSTNPDPRPCTNWGDESLEIAVTGTGLEYATNDFSEVSESEATDFWYRLDVVVDSITASNDEWVTLDYSWSNGWDSVFRLQVGQNSSGDLKFRLGAWLNGSTETQYESDTTLSVDTLYVVRVKWDTTNDEFAWEVNGTEQDSSSSLTAAFGHYYTYGLGAYENDGVDLTAQLDNHLIDDAEYPTTGTECALGGAGGGASIPAILESIGDL